jgi:Spy/CpxP family protein refolding chaperone
MKRTAQIALAVGAALTLGAAATVVNAHPYGYGMGWGGGPGYGMHGYGMGPGFGPGAGGEPCYGPGAGFGPGAMFNAYPGTVEDRLAETKSTLGITPKQEAAWKAYADNVKKHTESRQAWFAKMREARATGSAPEMLEQRAEIAKLRQSELESRAKAFKDLYAALTPEQKEIADQTLGGFGPGYRRGPRGRYW